MNKKTKKICVDVEGSFLEALESKQIKFLKSQIEELKEELNERKSEIEERKLEVFELRKELEHYKDKSNDTELNRL